jgi:predicted metal-dependent hydrolase
VSTGSAYLTVAGIDVDVVYKDIKNLHISVYPPLGRVRVAAPTRITEDAVRLAVVQRLPWIKKQREQLQNADRQTEREMVTGESHYVWGSRLRLDVQTGRSKVTVSGSKLLLSAPEATDAEDRRAILERWYRRQLKAAVPPLLEKWQPVVGKEISGWVVRRMRTKWGTCNPDSGTIWFNVELAKKHPSCLEYIVVHEMTHLHERTHNDRFAGLMDQFLPNWRALRDQLNEAPLTDEEWPT